MQLLDQPASHIGRHAEIGDELNHRAETPLLQELLHGDEEIADVVFVFIKFDVGIANDVKRIPGDDVVAGEEIREMRRDNLLDPDEAIGRKPIP
ncbi:MAG: hypothetical protein R2845_12185 [Thermomicrobiales bacterium]